MIYGRTNMERKINQIRVIIVLILILLIVNTVGYYSFKDSIKNEVTDKVMAIVLNNTSNEFQVRSILKPEIARLDSICNTKADMVEVVRLDSLIMSEMLYFGSFIEPMAKQINDMWLNNKKDEQK
jgi:hypothetical protein